MGHAPPPPPTPRGEDWGGADPVMCSSMIYHCPYHHYEVGGGGGGGAQLRHDLITLRGKGAMPFLGGSRISEMEGAGARGGGGGWVST